MESRLCSAIATAQTRKQLLVIQENMMRQLLCLLAIFAASVATLGCSSQPAPTAGGTTDTTTDLGDEADSMDAGAGDSVGSTTE